jgi:hypothetical protein
VGDEQVEHDIPSWFAEQAFDLGGAIASTAQSVESLGNAQRFRFVLDWGIQRNATSQISVIMQWNCRHEWSGRHRAYRALWKGLRRSMIVDGKTLSDELSWALPH